MSGEVSVAPLGLIPSLPEPWPAVVAGYLVEKHRRTGSRRTPIEYARVLRRFLDPIWDPGRVRPIDVHAFAYGPGPFGDPPSASTVCVRLAAIGGLFDFARRLGIDVDNPAALIRRPRPASPPPKGLDTYDLCRLLDALPHDVVGLRDRAIVILILLTGLRRAEALGLRVGDVDLETGAYVVRVKGGTTRQRVLPPPVVAAIESWLVAGGRAHPPFPSDNPLFQIGAEAFYARLRRHAAAANLHGCTPHALRHSAAQLRRRSGASIEQVSALLGHASIATTARYLGRLEPEGDESWSAAASALGIGESTRPIRPSMGHPRVRAGPLKRKRPDRCLNTNPVRETGGQLAQPPLSTKESTPS